MFGTTACFRVFAWVRSPWYKLVCGTFWAVFGMHHEQHVWKPGTEVRSVRVMMTRRLGCVDVDALRAIRLDHGFAGNVGQSCAVQRVSWLDIVWCLFGLKNATLLTERQHRLALAVHARTMSKITALVFLNHLSNATIGQDVAGMNQTVQHLSCLLNQVRLVWIVIQLVFCKDRSTAHRTQCVLLICIWFSVVNICTAYLAPNRAACRVPAGSWALAHWGRSD